MQFPKLWKKKFLLYVESPKSDDMLDSGFILEGWCLSTGKLCIKAIRAKIENEIFDGVYGIKRPDVALHYSFVPNAEASGFQITVPLLPKQGDIQIEVLDTRGKWHKIGSHSIQCSPPLKFHFERPEVWETDSSTIVFSGWSFHLDVGINRLILSVADISQDCSYGQCREDLHQAYPDCNGSRNSGFTVSMKVPPGKWQVTLKAHLETGEVISVQAPQELVVSYLKASKWDNGLKKLLILAREVKKRSIERQKRLGRPPSWTEIPRLMRKLVDIYRFQQRQSSPLTPPADFLLPEPLDPYEAWLGVNQWHQRSETLLRSRLESCKGDLPKISILMPVYNPEIRFLEEAIASVVNQVYHNWELCIGDDASTDSQVHLTLKQWAEKDQRIQVVFREENGKISAATNTAATMATGDFLLFLDQDDVLTVDALGEVALYLAENPDTDFLYSDEDKINSEGQRFDPQFKPDWSPELLLSYNYCNHLSVVRRSVFQQLEGLRLGFEDCQDYDLVLRATEICRHVAHLPLVLYHWRAVLCSTAVSGSAKHSFAAGEKAVQEALERRGILGRAYQPNWALQAGLCLFDHQFPDTGPSVAIIIPTKNKLKLLRKCISSLEKTTYDNYRIVIIDNESDDPATLAYLQQSPHQVLRIANPEKGLNFSAINHQAAKRLESDYLLFLHNDTEVITPQWLSQMVGYGRLKQVGAVGAKLLYPNKRIQHAGVIHGSGLGKDRGFAVSAFRFMPSGDDGYLWYVKVARNYSAVTGACLLTPRQLFLEMGGFDEKQFAVAYHDLDYCYRLVAKGYRCVYCPTAELIHKESCSQGLVGNPSEEAAFKGKYAGKIDPMYSPHLSLLEGQQFTIQPRRLVLSSLKPIKTLMCTHNLNWEGAPNHHYALTVKLKEMGVIDPVVHSLQDGPQRENYEEAGIKVYIQDSPFHNVGTRKDWQRQISCFAHWIQEQGVELIYANTSDTFYAVATAKKLGLPSIWNIHESYPWQTFFDQFGLDIVTPALECFTYPYRVIFVADATRELFTQLNSHHNFTTIHNGLNLARLFAGAENWSRKKARDSLDVNEKEIVILLLGTVCASRKGQHDLPLALAQLPEQCREKIKVFIVGDRPSIYSEELHALVANLPEELKQRITIVPETGDTARYYLAADIFILTSRVESFPLVILEAMAYQLPIITTPVFGVKEQVQNGVNAIFYEPGKIEELTAALLSLLEDQELRSRLAKNSPHVLNCLNNFEDMVSNYAQIFREVYLSKDRNNCQQVPKQTVKD